MGIRDGKKIETGIRDGKNSDPGSAVLQEANKAGSSPFLTLMVAESTVFCRLKFDAVVWLLLVRGTAVGGPETTAATAH